MRIALLSAVRPTSAGGIAALMPFLGRTVLDAQFDRACDLGAGRIVCLARNQCPEILALQHESEKRGVDFHLISEHLALVGLLAADNELIVFQDGVLFDREAINSKMANERGILVVPAEAGVAMGLERIDAKWAWAGLLIARGDAAAKLPDLPSDSDPASLLLRLALQARVPMKAWTGDEVSAGKIVFVDCAEVLTKHEMSILKGALIGRSWMGPGTKLAELAIKAMLPKALGWRRKLAVGSGILTIGAVALAAFDQAAIGGILLIFAAIILAIYDGVEALLDKVSVETFSGRKLNIYSVLFELSVIATLLLSLWSTATWATLALAPIALGLIRVGSLTAQRRQLPLWQDFLQDRLVLTFGLTAGLCLGVIVPILVTVCLAMLAFTLICEEAGAD